MTRQTVSRWRLQRRIPAGRRYRGRLILYSLDEFQAIKDFANRIEPAYAMEDSQAELFVAESSPGRAKK